MRYERHNCGILDLCNFLFCKIEKIVQLSSTNKLVTQFFIVGQFHGNHRWIDALMKPNVVWLFASHAHNFIPFLSGLQLLISFLSWRKSILKYENLNWLHLVNEINFQPQTVTVQHWRPCTQQAHFLANLHTTTLSTVTRLPAHSFVLLLCIATPLFRMCNVIDSVLVLSVIWTDCDDDDVYYYYCWSECNQVKSIMSALCFRQLLCVAEDTICTER